MFDNLAYYLSPYFIFDIIDMYLDFFAAMFTASLLAFVP